MVPANLVACDMDTGTKMLRFIDSVEEHEDVQSVYTNADIPEEAMEAE
jgi:transcriptional/translational regulatory protein YebC/TACO1